MRRLGRLDRGFNLPGWADRRDGRAPSRALLQRLRGYGFRAIRLPLDPERLLADRGATVMLVRRSAEALIDAGFSVTLDLHPEQALIDLFRTDMAAAGDVAVRAWRALAPALADLPADECFAELLNEPPLDPAAWLPLRERLAETVRKATGEHTLIWGAARYQDIDATIAQPSLTDENSIAAVHYYTPIGFTHQCADWGDDAVERIGNLPFPARRSDPAIAREIADLKRKGDTAALAFLEREFEEDWTFSRIADDFARLGAWSKATNHAVVLNEFGVLDSCVDPASRAAWIRQVRRSAERNGIAWTYWELDQGFGFVADRRDPRSIDTDIVAALLATEMKGPAG
ncbi:MAG: cellulase family glycosylhydrolase [Hyphomicrobiales bacterium]|nr:cellulase family glycosylhydrolase [Hyphomicrobiales bacterium]